VKYSLSVAHDKLLQSGNLPESIGNLENLQFLLVNRNPRLEGGIPETYSQLSSLRTALFDRTGLTGSLAGMCALPTFNEVRGDEDGSEYIAADCEGDTPKLACDCCTTCCNPADVSSCHVNTDVPNLRPEWEYVFSRYDYDFGNNNETYYQDRLYLGAEDSP